jgi:O-antigen/teichoic acid export membrane protein
MLTDSLKRLGKHSLIYALGPMAHRALGFLLLPLVTAYIGSTANYGVTEMAAVTLSIAGQLFGINLLHGMTRYYAEYADARDKARLVTTTLFLLVSTNVLALAAAILLRQRAASLLFGSTAYADAIVVVAAILLCQTIGQVGLRYLQILERSVAYGVLTTLKLLFEIGVKVWFLVFLGLEYMGVFYSVLCGELVIAVAMTCMIVATLGLSFSKPIARRLIKYSMPLVLSGLCMFVLHQADRFFVLRYQGEAEVGLYGLSYKLGSIANAVLLEAFGLIWFPYVFGLRDEEDVRLLCRKVLTYFTLIMCWASLFLSVFSAEIVGAMAEQHFFESHRAMPIIVLAYVFWAIFQVVHTAFFVREKTGQISMLVAAAAVLNCGLNFALVPRFGYMGAAWATLVTFAGLALAAWIRAEQIFPVRYEIARVIAPITLSGILFGASRLLFDRMPSASLAGSAVPMATTMPMVIVGKLALVLAFPAILWAVGYLKPEEKHKIKGLALDARRAVARRFGGSRS